MRLSTTARGGVNSNIAIFDGRGVRLRTQNALKAYFPTVVVILCFLHGFLKIRERMRAFRIWFELQSWTASVREVGAKLWKRVEEYEVAYAHPGCRRTSNAVDRPMNRMHRLMYAGRGLHGHQASSQRRLRGWALLLNFRPFAKRSGQVREHQSPAHRLSGKQYSDRWLDNLQVSASLMGRRRPSPAIR